MTFEQKLNGVKTHLSEGDIDLGFRKLIDCVLDTERADFYKTCIGIVAWQENNADNSTEYILKINKLIGELSQLEITATPLEGPLIEAKALGKTYGANKFSLGPVDLQINAGDIWGLVGENGNGKTTLLRILAHEIIYNSGTLSFHPEIQEASNYKLRTKLVYISQRTPKWYGSLKDNLKFTAAHHGHKGEMNELIVEMYIIRFGLWAFRNHKWSELSSGYKMRFELARTFLRSPKILLLDEPLANLDVMAQQMILEDLKHIAQSIANPIGIILSSQQLFEVEKISNKVLYLKHGKPTFLHDIENENSQWQTVLEIDMKSDRKTIELALSSLGEIQIHFNGGVYHIYSKHAKYFPQIVGQLMAHGIEITYVRDISVSTRRLFL